MAQPPSRERLIDLRLPVVVCAVLGFAVRNLGPHDGRAHRRTIPRISIPPKQRAECDLVRVPVYEGEDAAPRVLRGLGVLLVLSIEEAVRRAVVRDDLVLDACALERVL